MRLTFLLLWISTSLFGQEMMLWSKAEPSTPTYPSGYVFCNNVITEVLDVTTSTTGRVWMDRNLGASQVATAFNDAASYGDIFQWGRFADGHQCRNPLSSTTATTASTAVPNLGNPWDGLFIKKTSYPYDWLNTQNGNLWQGVNGTNNPCPLGYRVPTEPELNAERLSWSGNNRAGAFASPLKLPSQGRRNNVDGSLQSVGSTGYYWSISVSGYRSRMLSFNSTNAGMYTSYRANGFAVRCIKDFQSLYAENYVHCTAPTSVVDVVSATGKVWMDRNLGASRVAQSSTDSLAYGDLFQWGRFADGHQCRDSDTTSINATTVNPLEGNSWDGKFILETVDPYDWLATQDNNLWQGVDGANNPCPNGYRLPTASEWQAEDNTFSPNTSAGAFASNLKLPNSGNRARSNGLLYDVDSSGWYWSNTISGTRATRLYFTSTTAATSSSHRANGHSVRCIKD